MIGWLALLLGLQLVGDIIAGWLFLPVPGPVIGMGLLLVGLIVNGAVQRQMATSDVGSRSALPEGLERTGSGLLRHLSLLFVPAGVGVITLLPVLERDWLAVSISLVASTLLTIAVTASVLALFNRYRRKAQSR